MNDNRTEVRYSTILLFSAQAADVDLIQAALAEFNIAWHVIGEPDETLRTVFTLNPDLICLDSNGGYEEVIRLCQAIKGRLETQSIPVLVFADSVVPEARNAIFDAGAADLIVKPFVEREIQTKFELYLQHQVFKNDREKVESSVAALRLSEEIFAAAFHTSADMISISRVKDGVFINVNGSVVDVLGYRPEELIGKSSIEIGMWSDIKQRQQMAEMLRQAGLFRNFEVEIKRKDGTIAVISLSGTLIEIEGEACVLASLRDITSQIQTEETLRMRESLSRQFQERLHALHEVNLTLYSKDTIDELCYSAVKLGVDEMGFERVGLWFYDHNYEHISGAYGIDEQGGIRDERNNSLKLGEESPEYLLVSGSVRVRLWEDIDLKKGSGEIVGKGWVARALLWDGKKAIGFVSVDNYFSGASPQPFLLDLLALYGSLLGHLITRKRTEEALQASEQTSREFQERLRALLEVNLELTLKETVDDICYSAVDLGIKRLGFDRVGLWFFNEAQEYISGSYGTDGKGNVIDERHLKFEFGRESREYQILIEGLRVKVWDEVQLLDGEKNFRKGWLALAILWDGAKAIGLISIDNYLTGKSLPPYTADLLALYGGILGHLTTRKRTEESLRVSEGTSREFQERLRALHTINFDLYTKATVDELCYSAVGLAMSELGFERFGISFFDDAQENILGVYGTNEEGGVRDERHHIKKIDTVPRDIQLINSGKRVKLWEDVELLNYDGVVGHGWVALALLWDGTKAVGLISIDNYFSGTPPKPYTVDLLALFGNTLGHLITHKRTEYEIRRYLERLQVLRQIDRAILISEQLEAIASVVVGPLRNLLDCYALAIIKYDPVTATTQTLASTLETKLTVDVPPEAIQKLASGEVVSIIEKAEIAEGALDRGIAAYSLVPLVANDKLFGALVVGFAQPGTLDAEKLDILEQVSTSLAIALRQNELMQQLHRYTNDLEALVDARTEDLEEKTKELEAFMYSVSHDLRAPLRAIHGFSQIIRQDYNDDVPAIVDGYLDRIQKNALRMGELIDDLLSLSRIGQKEMAFTRVNFSELIEEIIAELTANDQMGRVEVEVTELPEAYGDRILLKQMLFNLITNGIKYSRGREAPKIEIGSLEKSGRLTYFVRDNGVGFDARYKDKLFGVFQRLHNDSEFEGMGIGLAIVERVIKRHGGEIWAEGQVNVGATFFFTLGDEKS